MASSQLINIRVNAFRKYKLLNETNSIQELQKEALKKSGLYDDLDSLMQAEAIYSNYKANQKEQLKNG